MLQIIIMLCCSTVLLKTSAQLIIFPLLNTLIGNEPSTVCNAHQVIITANIHSGLKAVADITWPFPTINVIIMSPTMLSDKVLLSMSITTTTTVAEEMRYTSVAVLVIP